MLSPPPSTGGVPAVPYNRVRYESRSPRHCYRTVNRDTSGGTEKRVDRAGGKKNRFRPDVSGLAKRTSPRLGGRRDIALVKRNGRAATGKPSTTRRRTGGEARYTTEMAEKAVPSCVALGHGINACVHLTSKQHRTRRHRYDTKWHAQHTRSTYTCSVRIHGTVVAVSQTHSGLRKSPGLFGPFGSRLGTTPPPIEALGDLATRLTQCPATLQ